MATAYQHISTVNQSILIFVADSSAMFGGSSASQPARTLSGGQLHSVHRSRDGVRCPFHEEGLEEIIDVTQPGWHWPAKLSKKPGRNDALLRFLGTIRNVN